MKRRKVILAGAAIAGSVLTLAFIALAVAPNAPIAATGGADAAPAGDVVQQTLLLGKPAVIEFGGSACVACREMKPILATLARDYHAQFAVVDLDIIKQPQYISRYRIQLMPTQVFYGADGKELGRHMGKLSRDEILARLEPSLAGRAP